MSQKIQLTIEQKDLFKMGNYIHAGKKNYYFFPFWIEEDPLTMEMTLLNWNELPKELLEYIENERNSNSKGIRRNGSNKS